MLLCFVLRCVVSCILCVVSHPSLCVVLFHFSKSVSEPKPTSFNTMSMCSHERADEFFSVAEVECCVACVVLSVLSCVVC